MQSAHGQADGQGRRRFLARVPPLDGARARQVNLAFLGAAAGWSVCIRRTFALDAGGNPGAGNATLLVGGPGGTQPVVALPTEAGAALFAAGTRKAFFTEWQLTDDWALRVYRLRLDGLVLAVGPASGPVPHWCGPEVTADPSYADEALAAAAGVPAAPSPGARR